jgi:hypothetical protein
LEKARELYLSGEYLQKNPDWHSKESPWKAEQILQMIHRNNLLPETICEVGCGAGEILHQLKLSLNSNCKFWGYEISPQAFSLCIKKSDEQLIYKLKDFFEEESFYDLILIIDILEHLEDYFTFLRQIKLRGKYKIFHIPLEMNLLNLLKSGFYEKVREQTGHIHYFTKDIVIDFLCEMGYEVIDFYYTGYFIERKEKNLRNHIMTFIRQLLFKINQDWTVRLLGGWSIMVLVK